jgi:hypothetical protein
MLTVSLPIQGVLQGVEHAFYGLCIHAGKQVLAAMMEGDRIALCCPPRACRTPICGPSLSLPDSPKRIVGYDTVKVRNGLFSEKKFGYDPSDEQTAAWAKTLPAAPPAGAQGKQGRSPAHAPPTTTRCGCSPWPPG